MNRTRNDEGFEVHEMYGMGEMGEIHGRISKSLGRAAVPEFSGSICSPDQAFEVTFLYCCVLQNHSPRIRFCHFQRQFCSKLLKDHQYKTTLAQWASKTLSLKRWMALHFVGGSSKQPTEA